MSNFTLTSADLRSQMTSEHVYHDFGAGGQNLSPQLSWTDAPEGTQSFLVVCHDADAPTEGGWWHWCTFNIPASMTSLETGQSQWPDAVRHAVNSYGSNGYGGACPPPGDPAHCYLFTVYALSTDKLDLPDGVQPAMVIFVANEHVLAKASVVSYYSR